jgi:hypothetical protein
VVATCPVIAMNEEESKKAFPIATVSSIGPGPVEVYTGIGTPVARKYASAMYPAADSIRGQTSLMSSWRW